MRKRPLGKTGIDAGELGLGTWGLSGDAYGPVAEAEVDKVIEKAVNSGVNIYETADVYGRGDMERKLGKLLPQHAVYIVTKLGTDRDGKPPQKRFDVGYLRAAFDRSRERLGREKIDVVLLHNPTERTMETTEPFEFLKELKRLGAITAWGVSAGSVEVGRAALKLGAEVLELAYNVFSSGDLHELAGDLAESGAGVLARSVLAHGLLAGQWSPERDFYTGDHRADCWTRDELVERLRQLDALRPLVTGNVHSVRSAALRFVLSNQLVSCAVLGPRSVAQLDQLVREAGYSPPYLRDSWPWPSSRLACGAWGVSI